MKNQINYKLQITNYSLTTNILTSRIPLTRTERSRSVGGFRGEFLRQAIIALFLIANILFLTSTAQAQNVGINTSVPDASAIMDITHTNRGLLIPRIVLTATNVAAPITAPALSLLVFNTNTTPGINGVKPGYYYWDGTKWIGVGTGNAWELLGNTGTTASNFVGTTDNVSLRFRTNNTEKVIIDSLGNVGIGISAPRYKLHTDGGLVGASQQGTNGGFISEVYTSSSPFESSLFLGYRTRGTGSSPTHVLDGDILSIFQGRSGLNFSQGTGMDVRATENQNATSAGARITFGTIPNASLIPLERMTIQQDGNVGIGTATPVRKLDINGDGINITNTANTVIDMQNTSGGHLFRTQADAGSYGIYDITSFPFVPRMSIANNGNVGLNNAAPANNTLEITQGTAGNSGLRFTNLLNAGVLGTDANGDVINTTTPNPANALFWGLTGNSGTSAGTNFIGTTDNIDLVFKRNGVQSGLLNGPNSATSFGVGALNPASTGNQSTAFGNVSLTSNTTGANNTAVGSQSLRSNTTGDENTALGTSTLSTNTTGSNNTAVGYTALNNSNGSNNTAVGVQAMRFNTTGLSNTAMGYNSLVNNTTGNENTALGSSSLTANSTGISNTALGYRTLELNTANGNTAVGHTALANNSTGVSNVAVGHQALIQNTTGGYNVAVGAYATLSNNTTGSWNTALGGNSMVNNTTGINNTATGGNSLNANTTGNNNTALGYQALFNNTTGGNNTATGINSMLNNSIGGNNTASGVNALGGNTVGNSNTATGVVALQSNTTGNNNTAHGGWSLQANTTGDANTTLGAYSMYSNTTGTQNTSAGEGSFYANTTGSQNTSMGHRSLYVNTIGDYNTAYGFYSLVGNTTGLQNTAVGNQAGSVNTTGSNNTFLGTLANVTAGNFTNATAIGYNAKVGASNSMVLGGTGVDALNVGIGLTNPTSRIHIFSVGSADIRNVADGGYSGTQSWTYNSSNIGHPYFIGFAARGLQSSPTYPLAGDVLSAYIGRDAIDGSTAPIAYGGADMYIKTTENHSVTNKGTRIIFSTTPNTTAIVQERMYIDHSGNVGIGIGSPVAKLQILGTTANNTDAMIGGTFSPTKVYLNSLGDAAIGAPLFNYRGFMGFNVSYDATSNRFVSDHDGGSSNPGSAIFHHSSGSLFFANLPSTSGTLPQQNTTTDLLNNTTMVLTAAHNVGIGTASPGDKLSVVGRGEFVTTIADHGVRIKGDGTDAQAILQYTNNAGTLQWANITGTPIGGGQLVFSTQFTPRMTLGQDGQLTNPGFSNPISADGQGNSIASLGWTTGNGALTASFYNSSAAPFAEGILVKVAGSAYSNILFEASTGAPNVASTTPTLIVRGNGSVGIGTATPNVGAKLDVAGSAFFANQKGYLAYYNPPGFDQFEVAAIGPATSLSLVTNGVSKLNITPAGQVGIGTITPTELLSVNGGANNLTGVWTIFSDERIKTVKDEFTDGLNVINQIRPVRFTYNTDAPFTSTDTQIGIVAQELEKIAPYMVTKQDFNGIKDLREVNGQAYTFLFINAIKEQQAQIEELKKEIEMLKKK